MITEVNNTFGERHLYLLDGSSPTSPAQSAGAEELGTMPTKTTFADYWTKEFHVSPFNSRKGGGYAQKALNAFPSPTSSPVVEITITLKSTKDHAKIVARLFSVGAAMKLDEMGLFGALKFIAAWWTVGLLTFPRILKEAFVLYFQKGLRVWFKPEVRVSSIGRLPTPSERYCRPADLLQSSLTIIVSYIRYSEIIFSTSWIYLSTHSGLTSRLPFQISPKM